MRLHQLLQESIDSTTEVEREYCFYGILMDPDQLEGLESVKHIQAEQRAENGRFRTRCCDGKYTLTVKVKSDEATVGPAAEIETTTDIGEDFFKQMLTAIGTCQYKTRYYIPGDGKDKWEIDVFTKSDGSPLGWVKLDYETSGTNVPDFPLDLSDVLDAGNESHKSRISEVLKLVAQKA